ncbi:MAG: Gfo/Idh/MocA family oxidoreductase [Thermoguttaceae bacterium]|nr:Gfo/Idh/MocA family oxidoreductase [Thermoguttaceae bacterium]MDW8036549.1 Gfo/Idh/MocA family oxidoreductase [Thermoguttaceae bacterium]
MQSNRTISTTRREFLQAAGAIAASSALAGVKVPHVHAAERNLIQVALIGCGGRGTGAAANALSVKSGPMKLVAMADVFQDRLASSYKHLKDHFDKQVDVPKDRLFLGFDAYKKAMDCLRPGDLAIFATPPAFRWVHFAYAIEKGIHVFMEKPVTVDGPTTRKMLELAKKASEKNLKVGVGLMVRHCRGRQELYKRIRDGEIGEIIAMRAYRMGSGGGMTGPKPPNERELLYQVRRFHAFLWASGGVYSDFYIHQIDECSWMKDAWPIKAQAVGGRHYRGGNVDQNFDTYAVEYTYPDGTKLFYYGRQMPGCHEEFASYAHGTKGTAIISTSAHTPGRVRTFRGQDFAQEKLIWAFPQPEPNPYQLELDDLVDAIRQDKPYNEAERGAIASLVTSMGRMAAHTGQIITYEQMLNCPHEFAPDVDKLTMDSPAPLQADKDGRYPVPQPGILKDREY